MILGFSNASHLSEDSPLDWPFRSCPPTLYYPDSKAALCGETVPSKKTKPAISLAAGGRAMVKEPEQARSSETRAAERKGGRQEPKVKIHHMAKLLFGGRERKRRRRLLTPTVHRGSCLPLQ